MGSKVRAQPVWFWPVVIALIGVLIGLYFVFAWVTPGLFAWVSSFSIVQSLTIGLIVVAILLGALFVWQRRHRRVQQASCESKS